MDQSHGEGIQFIAFEQDLGACCITSKTQNSEMQWVYKMKFGSNGTIPRYKVAKGFTQKTGINYSKTFSLVACYDSICTILSVITIQDMDIT